MRLLIDTSNETCLVIFYQQKRIIFQADIPKGINNTRFVASEIQKALKKLNLSLKDLKYIALGVGPGSYTGIRVGVTIAKIFSYVFKTPIIQLCSLDGFIPLENCQFISLIDAKSGGAYYRVGEKNEGVVQWKTEAKLLELDKIEELKSIQTLVCPDNKMLKRKLESIYNLKFDWIDATPNVSYLIELAEKDFKENKAVNCDQIEILYLRETQAEIERKENPT